MAGKPGDKKGGLINYTSLDKEMKRLVRIFLDEKDSYFLFQLSVMSGTTTNDMKHRFGHVVPKDAIYLLYYIFCFRVWQRVSRVVQEQHRNGDKH